VAEGEDDALDWARGDWRETVRRLRGFDLGVGNERKGGEEEERREWPTKRLPEEDTARFRGITVAVAENNDAIVFISIPFSLTHSISSAERSW